MKPVTNRVAVAVTNAAALLDSNYRYGYAFDDIGNRDTAPEFATIEESQNRYIDCPYCRKRISGMFLSSGTSAFKGGWRQMSKNMKTKLRVLGWRAVLGLTLCLPTGCFAGGAGTIPMREIATLRERPVILDFSETNSACLIMCFTNKGETTFITYDLKSGEKRKRVPRAEISNRRLLNRLDFLKTYGTLYDVRPFADALTKKGCKGASAFAGCSSEVLCDTNFYHDVIFTGDPHDPCVSIKHDRTVKVPHFNGTSIYEGEKHEGTVDVVSYDGREVRQTASFPYRWPEWSLVYDQYMSPDLRRIVWYSYSKEFGSFIFCKDVNEFSKGGSPDFEWTCADEKFWDCGDKGTCGFLDNDNFYFYICFAGRYDFTCMQRIYVYNLKRGKMIVSYRFPTSLNLSLVYLQHVAISQDNKYFAFCYKGKVHIYEL